MKAPLARLLPEMLKVMTMTRENIAATHLRPDLVRTKIFEAAKAGHDALCIHLPDGALVRGCENTATFEAWAKENGLKVDWEKRLCEMPDGRRVTITEPVVSWAVAS